MSEDDLLRWEARYAAEGAAPAGVRAGDPRLPPVFEPYQDQFPSTGHALELACGRGRASVWLAARGLEVLGVDISPTAVAEARRLAGISGVLDRCRFEVVDLDQGLPAGPAEDLILCHMFRDERLDRSVIDRLADGGLLAIAVRSEVGAGPGRFRAAAGELKAAFAALSVVAEGERDGRAWLLARNTEGRPPGSA